MTASRNVEGLRVATEFRKARKTDRKNRLLNMLREKPEASRKELLDELGVKGSTLREYVRELNAAGLLPEGSHQRFLAQGRTLYRNARGRGTEARRRKLIRLMRQDPTFSIEDLSDQLGVSIRTVKKDRTELRRQGFISKTGKKLWIAGNSLVAMKELNMRRILGLLEADPERTRGELANSLDISPGRTTDCVKMLKARGSLPSNFRFKRKDSIERINRKMDARRAKRKPIIVNGVSRNLFHYEIGWLAGCNPQVVSSDIKAMIRFGDPDIAEALKKRAKIREELYPKPTSTVNLHELTNKALLEDIGLTLEQVNAENVEWLAKAGPDDSLLRDIRASS